jgi:hypothetical protein
VTARASLVGIGILFLAAGRIGAAEAIAVAPGTEFTAARQPQVAVGPKGDVYVAFGVGDAIYCASSADGGRTFAPPVKVGKAGVLALGKRRGPRIVATADAVTITAPVGKLGGGKDGDTLAWRSVDNGRTWTGPVRVNSVPNSAREGLHDLAAGPDGRLFCVWVDLRTGKPQLFGASSSDGGASWGTDRIVYDGAICPCCQPSACFDRQGRLHVLWRNNVADDRDMYLIDSPDAGRTWANARKVGQGTWHLRACPMDGGGLACDDSGTVQTIWRRERSIYRCVDGGAEELLGIGEQGRAADGRAGVYLTWVGERLGTLFLLPPGKLEKPIRLAARASDPAIAAAFGDGPVVVVWEEPDAKGGPIRAFRINH